jgi:hypothetical protein
MLAFQLCHHNCLLCIGHRLLHKVSTRSTLSSMVANILVIAALKAALSSVLPSPLAPKSFTFRYTMYSELSERKGLVP